MDTSWNGKNSLHVESYLCERKYTQYGNWLVLSNIDEELNGVAVLIASQSLHGHVMVMLAPINFPNLWPHHIQFQ